MRSLSLVIARLSLVLLSLEKQQAGASSQSVRSEKAGPRWGRQMARASRMAREIQMLRDTPPPGVAAHPVDGRIDKIMAQIQVSFAT